MPTGSERRTGRRQPGAKPGVRSGARPAAGPKRGTSRGRPQETAAAPRPRFTGRAAVLVLVLALLMVSYASSMRAFVQQRQHVASLNASIAKSQAEVDRLNREKKRWADPAYVKTMAHQRFGWVLPGEIGFQVLDEDGKPLDQEDTLSSPDSVTTATRPVWWQSAWGSVVTAGEKPTTKRAVPPPVTKITPPKQTSSPKP